MTDKDPDLPADDVDRPDPDDPLPDLRHIPDHEPPATTEADPTGDDDLLLGEPDPTGDDDLLLGEPHPATTEPDPAGDDDDLLLGEPHPAGDDDLLLGEPEATTTTEADAALGLGPDTSATIHGSALPGHDPHADDQALLADPGPADDSATGPVAGGAGGVDREVVRERPPARRRGAAMVGAAALLLAALAGSFALGRASADDDSSPSGLAGTSGPPGWHDDDFAPGPGWPGRHDDDIGPGSDQGPEWPGRHDDGDKGPRSDWGDGIHWPSRGEGRHGPPPTPDDGAQQDDD